MSGPLTGCLRVRGRVLERTEGELAPLDVARDEGHLESCAACRAHAAEHQRVLAALRAEGARRRRALEPEAERVACALRLRLPREPRRGARVPARLRVAAAAAVLALASALSAGTGTALRLDSSALESVLARAPSWPAEVLDGLMRFTRRAS